MRRHPKTEVLIKLNKDIVSKLTSYYYVVQRTVSVFK